MLAEANNSYIPKYVQIQNYILKKIEEGAFTAGDRIPSEAELSRQFGVSRITVNTAIKELASCGVVDRIQGRGTFVLSPDRTPMKQPMAFASGIKITSVDKSSHKPHKLIEHGILQAGNDLCAKLNLEQGSYVYKIVRCVSVDDQPNELDYSYVPLSVCNNHTFDCKALEEMFLHDYVCKYLKCRPTCVKIYINTQPTEDMDISSLQIERREDMQTWDTFVYRGEEILAVTTTVCVSQINKPFIALEF